MHGPLRFLPRMNRESQHLGHLLRSKNATGRANGKSPDLKHLKSIGVCTPRVAGENHAVSSSLHWSPCTEPGSGYQGTRVIWETSSKSHLRRVPDRRKALHPCAHPKIGAWPELACYQGAFGQPDIFHLVTRRQCQAPRYLHSLRNDDERGIVATHHSGDVQEKHSTT